MRRRRLHPLLRLQQKYAFDVPVDECTMIRAARGGKVVQVYEGSSENCYDEGCPDGGHYGNYLTIEHQDGTRGMYKHMPSARR